MSYENISATISAADIDAIKQVVETIKTKLPFLVNLTPKERQTLPKVADKTIAFVEKAVEYAKNNKKLIPPYVNLDELKSDVKLAEDLNNLLQVVKPLAESLEDTAMAVGSEGYIAALAFYNTVKNASKMNVPGTSVIYQDLKQRFNMSVNRTEDLAEVNPN